jgi:tight adherence protein C
MSDPVRIVVGIAWGLVALVSLVFAARRRAVSTRTHGLQRDRATASSTPGGRIPWVVVARASGPVGRVAGDLLRRRAVRRADDAVTRALPVTIDLLGVAVGAGCTPYTAVETVAPWAPPEARVRLAAVARACALGSAFADALDEMATATPALRPVTDALLASDRYGAPVGEALTRLAAEERAALRRRAETRARKVPVRLLFPLVFLVLPAFGLLTVVPSLLSSLGRT